MYHDIEALLDMLQRSHIFYLLILSFDIRDKGIYYPFGLVPLFKRFIYKNRAETFVLMTFTNEAYSIIQVGMLLRNSLKKLIHYYDYT